MYLRKPTPGTSNGKSLIIDSRKYYESSAAVDLKSNKDIYLTKKEVKKILSINDSTFYLLLQKRELKTKRVAGQWLVHLRDLQTYMLPL